MNREILFRGKRIDNGEFVYGMPWIFKDHSCICKWKNGMCRYDTGYFPIEVLPETVGQYTGLTDKNGKKVFEHDIVCLRTGRHHVIKWEDGGFVLTDTGIPAKFLNKFTVTGTIHDNPELIGGVGDG